MIRNPDAKNYNKTHLPMDIAEERQILHRDYLAHCLRWSHVIKNCKIGERVLDLGAADGPLGMALYTNKFKPELYLGCDIRESMCDKGYEKLAQCRWAEFLCVDLCKNFDHVVKKWFELSKRKDPTIITSFEFIEHIPEKEVEPFLINVRKLMNIDTLFFLSTPCYDGKNKAGNHVKEWTYSELRTLLEKHFTIEAHFGTFMSQKDLKAIPNINRYASAILEAQVRNNNPLPSLFEALREYYDSNLLSILFAPLFPNWSRNCIWRLRSC